MKNKEFLTETKRKQIIANKEKAIIENFVKTFNKIKRIDESEIEKHDFDDFEERRPYVDNQGRLFGLHSDNQIAGAKLAYSELKDAGVPVEENRWHNDDPTVLFIINAEEDAEGKWVSPYYDSERAKIEGWKHPKFSDFVYNTLKNYNLYPEWADNATIEIRALK